MSGVAQLPPYFRGTEYSVRAQALPYHLTDTEMPKHWKQTGAGLGIVVGIADTGIDLQHPEVVGKVIAGNAFVGRRGGNWDTDGNGHGTHTSSTIVGENVGVAPKAKLVVAKVLGDNGSGSNMGVAEGLAYLVEQKVNIISLSLGSSYDDPLTRDAVLAAKAAGIIVIIATGNERANYVGFPAQHGVGIGAIDRGMKLADFSNRGKKVDLVGYGVDLYAAIPGGKYAAWSGTCLAEGSYVYGPGGPKPIQESSVGDVIYAFESGHRVERVIQGVHDRGTAEVFQLRAAGRDVLATASHEMLSYDEKKKELDWVRLGQLKEKHLLVVPKGLPEVINPYLDRILTDEICWLCGFFSGDGWVSMTTRGIRTNFAHKSNQEANQKVERIYKKTTGKRLTLTKNGNWKYDDSTMAALMFECLGVHGSSKTKTIPMWIWNVSHSKQKAFYDGYCLADGHQIKNPSGSRTRVSFECTSGDMIRRLACLADYWGARHSTVSSRERRLQPPNSPKPLWCRSHSLNVGKAPLPNANSEAVRRIGLNPEEYGFAKWRVDEVDSPSRPVFDLTVPSADCFVTQGLVTHNSMATPFISGIAANRLSAELKHLKEIKTTTDDDLLKLESYVIDLGPEGKDTSYGRGFPDLDRAFYNRLAIDPVDAPEGEPDSGSIMARVEEIGTDRRWNGVLTPERISNR